MTADELSTAAPRWTTASGDAWARRWQDTDRGLSGLAPHLLTAIRASAPAGAFRAFDVGCGPGSTTIAVAAAFPNAKIIAGDISPSLARLAQQRTKDNHRIRVIEGDAIVVASREGPFELIFSRHGVMFFSDPVQAFRALRGSTVPGGALVFSCFRDWASNPWASELASAAAGKELPSPGREPGGFAFADPDYVAEILDAADWVNAEPRAVDFRYVAAEGEDAVEHAADYLAEIGPASRVVEFLPEEQRAGALERMRDVIARQFDGSTVSFPAAAWIWRAEAGAPS